MAVASLCLAALVAVPAQATVGVGTVYDLTAGGTCTFADALSAANTNIAVGDCAAGTSTDEDRILLAFGTYTVPASKTLSGLLRITGGNRDATILQGSGTSTVLSVLTSSVVSLENLTVTGGTGDDGSSSIAGGITNRGTLTLFHVKVSGNTGASGFGAQYYESGGGVPGGAGGIDNRGYLTLEGTTVVSGNLGGAGGKGGGGSVVNQPTSGGDGSAGGPGGIRNRGTLVLLAAADGPAMVEGNTGGAGGNGGKGGNNSSCQGPGGGGGAGGAGGVQVDDGTAVNGPDSVVSANNAGDGGAAGAAGSCADIVEGVAGPDGDAQIERGGQTLTWTSKPPAYAFPDATFQVAAASTSGRNPSIGASAGCSYGAGTGSAASSVGTVCTFTAGQAGDGWFTAADDITADTAVEMADLSVTASSSTLTTVPGAPVSVTVTARNDGPSAAPATAAVSLGGLGFVSASPSVGSFANDAWALGTLASGAVETLTLWLTVPSNAVFGTPIAVSASVSSAVPDQNPGNDTGTVQFAIQDDTAPEVSYELDPATPGADGWYRTPVTLTWDVVEDESTDSLTTDGCDPVTVSEDQAQTTYTCEASSEGGTTSVDVAFGYDATAPTLSPSLLDGRAFAVGQSVPTVTSGADDATSGVASESCGTLSSATIGVRSISCQAEDVAGNTNSVARSYAVTDAFLGYSSPLPKSTVKSGSNLPVKFTLGVYGGGSIRVTNAVTRVVLATSRTAAYNAATSVPCVYSPTAALYQCQVRAPGKGSYFVQTWQSVPAGASSAWVRVVDAAAVAGRTNANGEAITVK